MENYCEAISLKNIQPLSPKANFPGNWGRSFLITVLIPNTKVFLPITSFPVSPLKNVREPER